MPGETYCEKHRPPLFSRETIQLILNCSVLVMVLAGCVAFWAISSHFEAAAFNRLTGKRVSTWDAMWVQLRVQEPAK